MTPRHRHIGMGDAGETAPGVTMLKQLWDIPTGPRVREKAPENTPTDIYSTPDLKKPVPRRRSRTRR